MEDVEKDNWEETGRIIGFIGYTVGHLVSWREPGKEAAGRSPPGGHTKSQTLTSETIISNKTKFNWFGLWKNLCTRVMLNSATLSQQLGELNI